jgi:hypothetical protein
MKKLFLSFVLIILPVCVFGQMTKNGFIISENTNTLGLSYYEKDRYTPSLDDLSIAESIIKSNKDTIKNAPNYFAGRKGIFGRYNSFFRQYIGFKNSKGDKIILINYVGNRKHIKYGDVSEPIVVLDGGNNYWQAVVNINQRTLVKVYINGK